MIYRTYKRAQEVADQLNQRKGYPKANPVNQGGKWTVIASYEYGTTR